VLPDWSAITGWAALRWWGGRWFDGLDRAGVVDLRVTLVTAAGDLRSQPGVANSHERLNPHDVAVHDGVPVVVPERAVFFEMRYAADLRAAVTALDLAVADDLTTITEVAAYVAAHPGWTGVQRARDALPLSDENSWSSQETAMRLVWVLDAGLPPPLTNRPVFDLSGRLLGTPDIIDPVTGTAGEYDGTLHLTGKQRRHDLRREAVFRDHGLECFTIVAADMGDRMAVADRMLQAHSRASRIPTSARRWTLDLPHWWQPSHTVALRRVLSGRAREALLRRRALRAS
jgi:hypothetical protein